MRIKRSKRMFCMFLSFALLVVMLQSVVLAEDSGKESNSSGIEERYTATMNNSNMEGSSDNASAKGSAQTSDESPGAQDSKEENTTYIA